MSDAASSFVFLHGGGQGGWVWQETLDALTAQTPAGGVRALTLDVPGCGAKRDRDTSGMTIDDVVADLARDIDAAAVEDAVLVGHSQAGTAIPRLIQARRKAFRRVVYISCCAPLPGQSVLAMMGSSRHGETPDEVGWPIDPKHYALPERYRAMFCNDMSEDEAARFLQRLGGDAWPEQAATETDWRYDVMDGLPGAYVICLADGSLPTHWQERFAERFGVERLVRIDAGHQVMNTRPHALAEVLRHEAAAK